MNRNSRTNNKRTTKRTRNLIKRVPNAGPPRGSSMSLTHPPQINGYEMTHTMPMRFTVTAGVTNQNVTYQNLLDTVLFASTALAPYDVFDTVKIKRVSVWAILAQGAPATVQVVFNNIGANMAGDRQVHTDTSLGVKPACVHAVPDFDSMSSKWQQNNAGNAFLLTAPAGSIVDVVLQFRNDLTAATIAQNASVGATVGAIFYRGLDGLASAGTNFPPPPGIPTF
jgi:hypothetical protein